jgi:hypothetical protein
MLHTYYCYDRVNYYNLWRAKVIATALYRFIAL